MLKDLIAKLRTKLNDSEDSEIRQTLSSLERESNDVLESLKTANAESKSRKLTIRELEAKLDDNSNSSETFQKKLKERDLKIKELETIKSQWDSHQENIKISNRKAWEEKAKRFIVEETNPNKAKIDLIRDRFKFGTDEEKLTDEDISKNLKNLEPYEAINYFQNSKDGTNFNNGNPKGQTGQTEDSPFNFQ